MRSKPYKCHNSAMSLKKFACAAALCGALCVGLSLSAPANDHIFPPAASAKSSIDFDSHGFLIHGQRTFLVSAGMEYARVPRALWRDRLLRFKRAGFNCVEVYTFWNWHEPQEGKFDFQGDHDLDAYLKLVHQMGMYAICRVGPYYCAEWDQGGYPNWLRFKPGVRVREDNAPFEAAVDGFFDKLIPIVAANQVNRGGSVVLVQLENEHLQGWGTDLPNGYFRHLRDKAVALGLEVPYFFSGLHHGGDPGSDTAMDDPSRPNPWFTTEFWSVWYSQYGPKANDAATYARRTWKIIAHGGNGYNYYMAHGGTNFAYTNNNEDAASYDYGAAVGQAGDLRPVYFAFKRAAWFARSFQDVLENSVDATSAYTGLASNPAVRVTARKSPAGTLVFLDNPGSSSVETQVNAPAGSGLPASSALTLAPGEIMPVVQDFTLMPGVVLQWAPTRIAAIVPQGNTTTLVVFGEPGSTAELHFTVPANAKISRGAPGWQAAAGTLVLKAPIPTNAPAEYSFSVGSRRLRVLAESNALADRTWFVDVNGQTEIVCGPAYVADASLQNGHLRLTTERPWQGTATAATIAYGPGDAPVPLTEPVAAVKRALSLPLSAWQARSAAEAAAPKFDDHAWRASDAPLQMGADGDLTADAWYRTRLQVGAAGPYTLQFGSARDRMAAYLDGARLPDESVHGSRINLSLSAGPHALALFTAHNGRDKLFGFMGSLETMDAKGLTGPALLQQPAPGGGVLTGWRVLPVANGAKSDVPPPADAPGWQNYMVGADAFGRQRGLAWFEAPIPPASQDAKGATLHFEGVDDNGTVFVNGTRLFHHEGYQNSFDVPLNGALHDGQPNTVAVLVQNTDGTGGIAKPVTLTRLLSSVPVMGWKMRGGPGDPVANSGWQPLRPNASFDGPAFFRTRFTAAPPAATGPHPIWRVITTGLGHGSVWVNGQNLGRYPEKIPINGLYVPECWLRSGANSLTIYDEDGKTPMQVSVQAESAASRDVEELTSR